MSKEIIGWGLWTCDNFVFGFLHLLVLWLLGWLFGCNYNDREIMMAVSAALIARNICPAPKRQRGSDKTEED